MADIGGDGTTTVQKLEGFRLGLNINRSHFTTSDAPTLDLQQLPAQTAGYQKLILSEIRRGLEGMY